MNKAQMTSRLAEAAGLTRTDAAAVVAAIFNPENGLLVEALRNGENVNLQGFGSFSVQQRAERKGRNPQTGKEITIPARNVCTFKPRKGLRSSMKDMVGA